MLHVGSKLPLVAEFQKYVKAPMGAIGNIGMPAANRADQ